MDNAEYAATLEYLYAHLPMFQRIGAKAYKADLTNTVALCAAIGNPQEKFKSLHIGGTNGKGSSSHMIAAILQCAGYKTGLYTSPHLREFTERIRVNGEEVPRRVVIDFVRRLKPHLESIQPSFFETTVAMAFDYFAIEQVDIAVIEVGLGGRLDSTNVIRPLVSMITNISWDHADLLGDTLSKIAVEKAGIIKPGVPVVIGENQTQTSDVFVEKARQENSELFFATDKYQVRESGLTGEMRLDVFDLGEMIFKDLDCQLKGGYQRKNLPGVLMVCHLLRLQGFDISADNIRQGLAQVVSLTGLKGRWQKLGEKPMIICDTGHNEAGISEVVKHLHSIPHEHLHFVLGAVADKDLTKMIALLPHDAIYYFCEARIPRALPATELMAKALQAGLRGEVIPDVNEAIRKAKQNASPDDLIFVGGSTFIVAEIDNL